LFSLIVRLWNSSDQPGRAVVRPARDDLGPIARSSPIEESGPAANGPLELAGYGIVTLRFESK